jgi:hypothetical protein
MKTMPIFRDGAVERNRTSTSKLTATSTLRVYHFRHDREFLRLSAPEYGDSPPNRQANGPAALANLPKRCKDGLEAVPSAR